MESAGIGTRSAAFQSSVMESVHARSCFDSIRAAPAWRSQLEAMIWAATSAAMAKRQAAKTVMTFPFEPTSSAYADPNASSPVGSLWKIQNRSINVPVIWLFSICSSAVKRKSVRSMCAEFLQAVVIKGHYPT